MKLERPIVFFDVETTGLDIANDRIIEISMIKIFEDGKKETLYKRINPEGRIITPEAEGKHGIKLEDLQDCYKFKDIAQDVYKFIEGCDLGGYNCRRFDIPMLVEEFLRAGISINIKEFKIIDVYKILIKAEPRTLEAIYKRFMGKELDGAHGAEADILGTIDVLEKMEEEFEIPNTVNELHEYALENDSLDLENKLVMNENKQITFNFGKHKGKTIQDVYKIDPEYYDWIINKSDMTRYIKSIFNNVRNYIQNKLVTN